jgi:hypothetical protein
MHLELFLSDLGNVNVNLLQRQWRKNMNTVCNALKDSSVCERRIQKEAVCTYASCSTFSKSLRGCAAVSPSDFSISQINKAVSVSERTGGTYPVSSHSNAARDHFTSRDQRLLPHILLHLHKTARKSLHMCASLQNKMFIPPCVSLILRTANKLTRVWEIMQFYSSK